MTTGENIITLAEKKLEASEILFDTGYFDDAYYLAGYALELFLKARICTLINIPNFYDFENSKNWSLTDSKEKRVIDDNLYKPFKVHNYLQLLILSGLYLDFKNELAKNSSFINDWSVVKDWDESFRYKSGKDIVSVEAFINSSKNLIAWLRKRQ